MKKKNYSTIIAIGILFSSFLYTYADDSDLWHSNKLIVKFSADSELLIRWQKNGRSGKIDALSQILDAHNSSPFISDNTLKALRIRLMMKQRRTSASSSVENLERIAVIDYSGKISPAIAAKKISSYSGIEYAEPMPIHRIFSFPNDSLAPEQYHLDRIQAVQAWDAIADDGEPIIIGIVDTGTDYTHEDLAENIWENPGETGLDSLGNDKRTNGIDDDGNGFIDDWRGWDFASSDSTGTDNDPMPGNDHGTHVAGIAAGVTNNFIGIAGVAKNAKILPVKVGPDSPFIRAIYNGYEGILYAAVTGAHVINCSWGSSSRSTAEAETIAAATALGSVIVCAAGNNNQNQGFFPAGYKGVLSVAALGYGDIKAWYSNYHHSVGISAPGSSIYSTIPVNEYARYDGTSMASPVVAGVAAMVIKNFPNYSPLQVIEHLKATTENIDSLNYLWKNKLGTGRVDAYKAVTEKYPRSLVMTNYIVRDENSDGALDAGELVEIDLSLFCPLNPLDSIKIIPLIPDGMGINFIKQETFVGNFTEGEEKTIPGALAFIVPDNAPMDYNLEIELLFAGSNGFKSSASIQVFLKPSFRTMRENNIALTLNSKGNFAYNDYPLNAQGSGFSFKNSSNMLFEGALMIGRSSDRLSNGARSESQSRQDKSFSFTEPLRLEKPGRIANLEGFADFSDFLDSAGAGVRVNQTAYQFNSVNESDFIIVNYDIINESGEFADSVFAGLYFDWDIGVNPMQNIAEYRHSEGYGCVYNSAVDTLPIAGVKLLTNQPVNFFGIDNDGTTEENPGVWDGFTKAEKWKMMTSGIAREKSSVTDASMVIAAGPLRIAAGDTIRVTFAIFSGYSFAELDKAAANSLITAGKHKLNQPPYKGIPDNNTFLGVFPNPSDKSETVRVDFALSQNSEISVSIYNVLGQFLGNIETNKRFNPGYSSISFSAKYFAPGAYFLKFSDGFSNRIIPFRIVR